MGSSYESEEGTFVEHTSCDKCGSKDNRAVYTDGHSYCFGCGAYKSNTTLSRRIPKNARPVAPHSLPNDTINELPTTCYSWLKHYGVTNDEIEMIGCCWSERESLLIFPQEVCTANEEDPNGPTTTIIGYIGRRFGGVGSKYVIRGSKTAFKRIYGMSDTIVYTEDLISAVKVGRLYAARPLFGTALSRLDNGYAKHVLWLDKDKQYSSIQQCKHWRQYGYNIRPMITDLDPKEYNDKQIQEYLA